MSIASEAHNGEQGRDNRVARLGDVLSLHLDSHTDNQRLEAPVSLVTLPPPDAAMEAPAIPSGLPSPGAVTEVPRSEGCEGPSIQSAARDIANTLIVTMTGTLADVHRRADSERARLDSVAGELAKAATAVRQVADGLDALQAAQAASAAEVSTVLERLSAVESRIGDVAGRLDELSGLVRRQSEELDGMQSARAGLSAAQQSLHARIVLTERALRAADMDRQQRDAAWDRFIASLTQIDMRGGKRVPAFESVRAVVLGEPEVSIGAQILDVSDRGLGMNLDTEVTVGSQIRIDIEDATLLGTVRYCRPSDDGFAVGLLLEQPLRDQAATEK